MISIEEKEKLLNNLKNNSLNSFTIEYIIQYANISTDIFNIDHNILINRLSNNLTNNIILSKKNSIISNILGGYIGKSKQIFINSKMRNKQHIISLIFHELDHVANYQYIELEDKLKYLDIYAQRLHKEFPLALKIPFIKSIIIKRFLNSNSFSSGFNNPLVGKALGVNLNLFKEGFTTYKQSKYEQYLNLSDRLTIQDNQYKNAITVAQALIEIIGEDTIMQLEQNNNILELKKIFEKITQKQIYLENLILQLNNASTDSNRTLENQKILNNTLKKFFLCKKAYDYGIILDSPNLSLSKIQDLVTSYEKKIDLQKITSTFTFHNPNNKEVSNIISNTDSYTR